MKPGCIFSYSSHESALVHRIYDDLERSGATCWRYEHDTTTPGHVLETFKEKVNHSRFFLFVDSAVARQNELIRQELTFALTLEEIVIIPIIVEPPNGPQRHSLWSEEEVFKELTGQIFIDLSEHKLWDHDLLYEQELGRLCSMMGLSELVRDPKHTRTIDFEAELYYRTDKNLEVRPWERVNLRREWEGFLLAQKRFPKQVSNRIAHLREICDTYRLISISVMIEEVLDAVRREDLYTAQAIAPFLLAHFKDDPRSWSVAAGVAFQAGALEQALDHYKKSTDLIKKMPDYPEHQQAYPDVVHNLVETLLDLGSYVEAEKELDNVLEEHKGAIQITIARLKWLVMTGSLSLALTEYQTSLNYLNDLHYLDKSWIKELHASLFRYFAIGELSNYNRTKEIEHLNRAKSHMQRALELRPGHILYLNDLSTIERELQ